MTTQLNTQCDFVDEQILNWQNRGNVPTHAIPPELLPHARALIRNGHSLQALMPLLSAMNRELIMKQNGAVVRYAPETAERQSEAGIRYKTY